MGIYITLGIVFALFIGAAFVAARLQDKLQKERNLVKSLLNDIAFLRHKTIRKITSIRNQQSRQKKQQK